MSHGRHPVFVTGQKCHGAFVKANDCVKMLNTNGVGAFFALYKFHRAKNAIAHL